MASSKTRPRNRPAPGKAGRPAAAAGSVRAATRPAARAPRPADTGHADTGHADTGRGRPAGPPLGLQLVSLVLAVLGLATSAYETYAHYNGSRLLGCSTKPGTFDCTAVITSSQSMVFGVFPVAVLGLAFYVFAVAVMSPWAWRARSRAIGLARLVSLVVGMGFVLYLIYAEIYQIGQICEYCTGVHVITFLLFGITVFSAAIWGLGPRKDIAA